MAEFVPADFEVPPGLETSEFVLEPLGPEHDAQDYDAWTSSMDHIAETPGYPDGSWPREMTRDENRADLQRHADDFFSRKVGIPACRVPKKSPGPRSSKSRSAISKPSVVSVIALDRKSVV